MALGVRWNASSADQIMSDNSRQIINKQNASPPAGTRRRLKVLPVLLGIALAAATAFALLRSEARAGDSFPW